MSRNQDFRGGDNAMIMIELGPGYSRIPPVVGFDPIISGAWLRPGLLRARLVQQAWAAFV